MAQATRESARAFVQAIEMPSRMREAVVGTKPLDFDQLKNQAAVVGSEVVSFVMGITAERRQDVVNATLLAQSAVVLGAAPTALAVVTATIEAMKSTDEDSPWITIFDRESRSARSARFQVTLAEQDEPGQFMVTTMALALEAESTITQVLLFKIWKNRMSLKHCSGKVTINEDVLASVRDDIKQKLADRTAGYVDALDI